MVRVNAKCPSAQQHSTSAISVAEMVHGHQTAGPLQCSHIRNSGSLHSPCQNQVATVPLAPVAGVTVLVLFSMTPCLHAATTKAYHLPLLFPPTTAGVSVCVCIVLLCGITHINHLWEIQCSHVSDGGAVDWYN